MVYINACWEGVAGWNLLGKIVWSAIDSNEMVSGFIADLPKDSAELMLATP